MWQLFSYRELLLLYAIYGTMIYVASTSASQEDCGGSHYILLRSS